MCVWTAAVVGVLHAAFSAYWALGGQWLLATVGRWAVRLSEEFPVRAGLVLGLVALVKLVAAVVPVGVAYGRVPRPRTWRAISWVGGLVLVAYGGVNTVVALAVVAGLVVPEGGYDAVAITGHAFLWDPLFLLWGGALVLHLLLSRPAGRADGSAASPPATPLVGHHDGAGARPSVVG